MTNSTLQGKPTGEERIGREGPESEEPTNEPENEEPANDEPANTPLTSVPKTLPLRILLRYSPDEEERRSKYPIANYVATQALSQPIKTFTHTLSSCYILSSVEEALVDPKWEQTIQEELEALQKNNTWRLVDGSIDRYKARLMAKRFTQTYGVDYLETFSIVAKLNTMRVLLYLTTNLDWPLLQLDVKNAFLYGDLEEEIYMDIPPRYTDADWAGNILDRKSTSGYFTFVGGNLVTWRSKKQKVVALSSAEAEFKGMAKDFVSFFGFEDY
ncbi:Retrovirus-related Pol polyprotein from transposon RE1 [Vitis vinifera]|uniref:Retrovirus-related Pol polyprotein from transposon RE1 n=1 Tax=Vitis vinifera TaxID=29760 RepID=A0A438G8H1_VITVI|nr:Retrovirus-related Pol polyprotein from transposon RE1 [Vitis vinifera]